MKMLLLNVVSNIIDQCKTGDNIYTFNHISRVFNDKIVLFFRQNLLQSQKQTAYTPNESRHFVQDPKISVKETY